jgi:hypothetical protein
LILTVVAALLLVSTAGAQQQAPPPQAPPPQRPGVEQRCAAVLPRQAAEQILANYRERLRTARENAVREERALRALLVADNSTKAALDAQTLKTNDARNVLSRVRLDMLWDLRSVVPAQDRAIAFRCAERLLMRGR